MRASALRRRPQHVHRSPSTQGEHRRGSGAKPRRAGSGVAPPEAAWAREVRVYARARKPGAPGILDPGVGPVSGNHSSSRWKATATPTTGSPPATQNPGSHVQAVGLCGQDPAILPPSPSIAGTHRVRCPGSSVDGTAVTSGMSGGDPAEGLDKGPYPCRVSAVSPDQAVLQGWCVAERHEGDAGTSVVPSGEQRGG
jgi:hypothetical protein